MVTCLMEIRFNSLAVVEVKKVEPVWGKDADKLSICHKRRLQHPGMSDGLAFRDHSKATVASLVLQLSKREGQNHC